VIQIAPVTAPPQPPSPVLPPEMTSAELKQAEEVCKIGLQWPTDSMNKRKLLRTLTRIQGLKGNSPLLGVGNFKDNDAQVIVLLEMMKQTPESNPKKLEYLQKAAELLEESDHASEQADDDSVDNPIKKPKKNVELPTLLAMEAFLLKNYTIAKTFVKKVLETAPDISLSSVS
jgi:hypothetical protein